MNEEKTLMDFVKAAKSQIAEVDVSEVDGMLGDGYQILDIREPGEFAAGAIAGAMNVPRGVLEPACDRQFPDHNEAMQDRDKKWLLFCATSGRSAMATVVLQQMGFKNVKNINGGMNAWKGANKALVKA